MFTNDDIKITINLGITYKYKIQSNFPDFLKARYKSITVVAGVLFKK